MNRREYREYRKTSVWKEKRKLALDRAGKECEDCHGLYGNRLNVHHLTYDRIGEEEPEDLKVLCSVCHMAVHELEKRGLCCDACGQRIASLMDGWVEWFIESGREEYEIHCLRVCHHAGYHIRRGFPFDTCYKVFRGANGTYKGMDGRWSGMHLEYFFSPEGQCTLLAALREGLVVDHKSWADLFFKLFVKSEAVSEIGAF